MISLKRYTKSAKYFYKHMLISFFVVLLIPTITSAVLSILSTNNISQQQQKSDMQMLDSIYRQASAEFSNAMLLSERLAQNETLVQYANSDVRSAYTEYKIRRLFRETLLGIPSIESIYVYIPSYDYVISNNNGSESSLFFNSQYKNTQCEYEDWLELMDKALLYPKISCLNQKTNGTAGKAIIVKDITYGSNAPDRRFILAIQLNLDSLINAMDIVRLNAEDCYEILVGDQILCSNMTDALAGKVAQMSKTLGLSKNQSYMSFSLKDKKTYQIYYYKLESSSVSLTFALARGGFFSKNNLPVFSLAACFLISTIIAVVFSSKRTKPLAEASDILRDESQELEQYSIEEAVSKYVFEHQRLRSTVKSFVQDIRDEYLDKFLRGEVSPSKEVQQQIFEVFDIPVRGESFAVAFIRQSLITEEAGLVADTELSNDHLIIAGQLSESAQNNCRGYLVSQRVGDSQFACILSGYPIGEAPELVFYRILSNMQEKLLNNYSLSVTFCLGNVVDKVSALSTSYEDAKNKAFAVDEKNMPGQTVSSSKKLVEKCLEYIPKIYNDSNITVTSIASYLKVSQPYLSMYFKDETGIGLLEYLHQFRINSAKDILQKNPDILIKELALMTGYINTSSFIRVFKKMEGITPGEYRDIIISRVQQ